MKKQLVDIATIQTGYFAKPEANGDLICLQSRHFDDAGRPLSLPEAELRINSMSRKHLLSDGDVLFAAKGPKNFAVFFKGLGKPAVASTTFFVIRIHEKLVLPEYLTWYLNRSETREYLQAHAKGTSIVSISKSAVGDLWVEIPSLEMQSAVLKINSLLDQETRINYQLAELRSNYIQSLLNQTIKTNQ